MNEIEKEVDETINFETSSSDLAVVAPESQEKVDEPKAKDESADTDEKETTDGKGGETKVDDKKDDAGDDATAEKVDKKPRAQKRIDELVRQRETEKRKVEELEGKLKKFEKKPADKDGGEKEPVEGDYDSYDDYLVALDKHDAQSDSKGEAKKADTGTQDDHAQESTLTDSQKTAMAVVKEAVDSSEGKPEDFDAVALADDVDITGDMLEALAECDNVSDVMYHLGKNKDVAAEIAKGSPAQQMRAITKLDSTVNVKPTKPVKTTNASDPISPVGGSDAQQKGINDMSFREYEAHMNKIERGE